MVLIEWTPNLSVDIKSIDEQHKKLFGYMNELYDALEQKKEQEVISRLFNDLDDYVHTHFTLEETNFEKFNYAQKDAHIAQHKMFIQKIAQLKKEIGTDLADPEDLLMFLVDWITNHIKISDHNYMDCFHQNGLY